jgi:hypothetical protein
VHPLGASRLLSELPVIVTALRALLARVLRRRMVEPQRRFFDLQRHYNLRSIKRVRACSQLIVQGGLGARRIRMQAVMGRL